MCPRNFLSFRTDNPERLCLAIPWRRQEPHIRFRLRVVLRIDYKAPVPRPIGRKYGVIRLQQKSLFSSAAGRLPKEVVNYSPIRSPDDTAPVRRPDGRVIIRRIEGEAIGLAPRFVIQPKFGCAYLGIGAVGDKTFSVRGEPGLANACGRLRWAGLPTTAILPEVLAALPIEARIEDQDAVVRDGEGGVIVGMNITPNLV